MLQKLTIKNVALIEQVEIEFTDRLNVLSGETGAGKSVIIESLNFVLGAKAERAMIRRGQNECLVKAEFSVNPNENFIEIFNDLEIEVEDVLIITRKFNVDGKSSIKVNGNTVTLNMLKKLTALLVDVHGQSEHFYLLKSSNQLSLIDHFGGEKISLLKEEIKKEYAEYKSILKELEQFGGDESQRLMKLDVLNYQINEISVANIKENEEEELLAIKQKLKHQEKIINALSALQNSISEEGGVSDRLANVSRVVSNISEYSNSYSELADRVASVFDEIDDISDTAYSLLNEFDYAEVNPDDIEERLGVIKSLKKKYGNTIEEIYSFLANAQEEKDKIENFNKYAEELIAKQQKQQQKVYNLYSKLSDLRRDCAQSFKINVLNELAELSMKKAQFDIIISEKPTIEECGFNSSNGFDNLEFMFSANLGEELKPLSAVISGGEMSRFMLSIKAQTAKYNDISTFIFDEIDAGISGNVAKVVAEKFAKISKDVQVIAISHLPQISAMADNNLLIEKNEYDDRTLTSVKKLNDEEKVAEITRLIGGNVESLSAISHSKELIEVANNFKNSL